MITKQLLILETEVCDSNDPYFVIHRYETSTLADQSLHGPTTVPSPAYIERVCHQYDFKTHRICLPSLNYTFHRYDWEEHNSGLAPFGQRALWLCYPKEV